MTRSWNLYQPWMDSCSLHCEGNIKTLHPFQQIQDKPLCVAPFRAHISPTVAYIWQPNNTQEPNLVFLVIWDGTGNPASFEVWGRAGIPLTLEISDTCMFLTTPVTLEISDTYLATLHPTRARSTWCILIWQHNSLLELQGADWCRGKSWQPTRIGQFLPPRVWSFGI